MSRNSFTTIQQPSYDVVLIVSEEKNIFTDSLRSYFMHHDVRVHTSLKVQEPSRYKYVFIIGNRSFVDSYSSINHVSSVVHVVFMKTRRESEKIKKIAPHAVFVVGDPVYASQKIEQIMWYVLEKKQTPSPLMLESITPVTPRIKLHHPSHFHISALRIFSFFKKKRSILIWLIVFIAFFGYTVPLAISSHYTVKAVTSAQQYDFSRVRSHGSTARIYLQIAEVMYMPVRPLYLLLSLAQIPEDLFFLNHTASSLMKNTEDVIKESKRFAELIFQRERDEQLAKDTRSSYDRIDLLLSEIEQSSVALYRKLPGFLLESSQKKDIEMRINQLKKTRRLFAYLPQLMGEQRTQKILLLFANNMELRPGGGFIGSFGILELSHFGVKDLQVYDVYDADGQLTAHIDPPHPIRTYLGQPHWFLRDSAFFPDFQSTYQQAKVFLQKEIGATDWDGGVLITTSAVKDIIGAFGSLYLPDYKENITKDNFYIKTQYHSENNFFPGSTQKKSFLSDLVKQLFVEMEQVNSMELASALVNSLDQKFIVAQSEDVEIQKTLDNLYWTGRTATPFCPPTVSENCFSDYQMVLDANLGVNKVNAFIERTYQTATTIDETGLAYTTLTLEYTNNALQDVYPGGSYTNYMQVHLPSDARILYISRDRQRLESYDTQTEKQKVVGFLLNLPPQASSVVEIQYSSSLRFKKGSAVYQLIVQKQIGAFSNDLTFTLTLPNNMHLVNTNFSPLVKNSQIIYNTDLSTDRVFFIELSKE